MLEEWDARTTMTHELGVVESPVLGQLLFILFIFILIGAKNEDIQNRCWKIGRSSHLYEDIQFTWYVNSIWLIIINFYTVWVKLASDIQSFAKLSDFWLVWVQICQVQPNCHIINRASNMESCSIYSAWFEPIIHWYFHHCAQTWKSSYLFVN